MLDHLAAEEKTELRALALAFVREKQWHGAQGVTLTEDIQLAIALQACLLVLKLGLERARDVSAWLAGEDERENEE